ncbi:hypothetical protein EMCRGX_G032841 [Ephydatia muelleri]
MVLPTIWTSHSVLPIPHLRSDPVRSTKQSGSKTGHPNTLASQKKSETLAECSVCFRAFNFDHQGERDILRHLGGADHIKRTKELEKVIKAEEPFSLNVDGSNDNDLFKMYPLCVRVFDVNRGHVCLRSCVLPVFQLLMAFSLKDCTYDPLGKRLIILLIRKTMGKFIRPELLTVSDDELVQIDFGNPENQLAQNQLFIGFTTRQHEVLHHASFCNFELRMEAEISSIEFFIERYPVFFESLNLDDLHDEFVLYKTSPDLTPEIMKLATVTETIGQDFLRMDIIWDHLSKVKDASRNFKFPIISRVAKLVLTIPHSNADAEMVFSIIGKNKVKSRSDLALEGTLSSLKTYKVNQFLYEHCYQFEPSTVLLDKAKKATTTAYNKAHQ